MINNSRKYTLRVSAVCFGIALGALVILSLAGVVHTVRAQNPPSEKVLYNFRPSTGWYPSAAIARDSAGNIYGTTIEGGANRQSCGGGEGCGNIFKISPTGQQTILYTFTSSLRGDGIGSNGVILDGGGNLYGSTQGGGSSEEGTVFELTSSGSYSVLHTFTGGTKDGYEPGAVVVMDSAGNLYGSTVAGGGTGCSPNPGCGIIYKITSSGQETVLYRFTGGAGGWVPDSTLMLDSAGDLYGTAAYGGSYTNLVCQPYGCGIVFKLDTSGNFNVLYSFTGGADGTTPRAGLVMDASGNLYGDAGGGGDLSCGAGYGCGTVFEIDSSGNFTVLYAFTGSSGDGEGPDGTLLRDSAGNLYGTTYEGGNLSCNEGSGCGIVFRLDTSGNETILHAFAGGTTDGEYPDSALITDGKGNLYGTTFNGGTANGGVIFEVR
jgi:uncharacterized repeat protein (TIGR03803 family)